VAERYAEAAPLFEALLGLLPEGETHAKSQILCRLSACFLNERQYDKALAAAEEAVLEDDSHWSAHDCCAEALFALQRYEDTTEACEAALEQNSLHDPEERARLENNLAQALEAWGEENKALMAEAEAAEATMQTREAAEDAQRSGHVARTFHDDDAGEGEELDEAVEHAAPQDQDEEDEQDEEEARAARSAELASMVARANELYEA